MNRAACEECGARLIPGLSRCDLCGWPVDTSISGLPTDDNASAKETGAAANVELGPYCIECGSQNLLRARYCSQCGAQLQTLHRAPRSRPATVPPKASRKRPASVEPGVTRQVALIIGLAVLLVVVFFMVTAVSKTTDRSEVATTPVPETIPVAPLGGELAERIALLDEAIARDSGHAKLEIVREKMLVLWQAGRIDLAAETQQHIAEATNLALDWEMAGNLYYRAMNDASENTALQARMATLAVTAYQEVLSRDPGNLDVRTDMATAYLSTGSPMQGVTEIKRVLEEDPNHLSANFNYGLMLLHINRTDKALEQLEHVLDLAPDSSAHYQSASALIARIRTEGGT